MHSNHCLWQDAVYIMCCLCVMTDLHCSVGGNIQAMVWDPTGERLAVQFTGTSLVLQSSACLLLDV